jgi:hypothetical protein
MSFLIELQKVKKRLNDDTLIEAKRLIDEEIERRSSNDVNNSSKVV